MARKKTTKERKDQRKRAARRSQVEKDNERVPRDWANDPAWLRDLLRRTWEALGDDMDTAFRLGEPGCLTASEFDLLTGQVAYVVGVEESLNRSRAPAAPSGGGS